MTKLYGIEATEEDSKKKRVLRIADGFFGESHWSSMFTVTALMKLPEAREQFNRLYTGPRVGEANLIDALFTAHRQGRKTVRLLELTFVGLTITTTVLDTLDVSRDERGMLTIRLIGKL